jgi:hypothetical protein
LAFEGGVERHARRREVEGLAERRGLGGAVDAVHARVLPLDRQRAPVADVVERDDDLLEVDVAAADAAEVPVAAGSPKVVWPPNTPTLPSPRPHQASFMWTWKIRSAKRRRNAT